MNQEVGRQQLDDAIIGLNDTSAGEIIYDGRKINGKNSHSEKSELIRKIQMIFQDPAASLNERATVDYIISEGLINHHLFNSEEERQEKVKNIMHEVGLLAEHLTRYPLRIPQVVNVNGSVLPVHLSWNQNLSLRMNQSQPLTFPVRAQVLNL